MANHGTITGQQNPDTIGAIVAQSPLKAAVFQKHGIDFCCGGGVSLEAACLKRGLNPQQIREELEDVARTAPPMRDWTQERDLGVIIDHILEEFHEPLRFELPRLNELMERVARVHGHHHPELITMRGLYADVATELLTHMQKEEQVLFPMMLQVQKFASGEIASLQLHCGSVQAPIRQMESEHESVGEQLRQLRALSSNYELPEGACNSYRALWAGLERLEEDLHRHIHLENFVLQPLAVRYERG